MEQNNYHVVAINPTLTYRPEVLSFTLTHEIAHCRNFVFGDQVCLDFARNISLEYCSSAEDRKNTIKQQGDLGFLSEFALTPLLPKKPSCNNNVPSFEFEDIFTKAYVDTLQNGKEVFGINGTKVSSEVIDTMHDELSHLPFLSLKLEFQVYLINSIHQRGLFLKNKSLVSKGWGKNWFMREDVAFSTQLLTKAAVFPQDSPGVYEMLGGNPLTRNRAVILRDHDYITGEIMDRLQENGDFSFGS